ncbi:hypothetical protein ANCCAN_04057 [Ancylostoma caninum]|uniref:Uncharacterized protein n=1 Tax=Ancylostoma caninum TaxID=29170 RepID=A0A368GZP8_ANCCA|nr:hypothetical protein ANCCAN_04057 [Ancylostoma caninum]
MVSSVDRFSRQIASGLRLRACEWGVARFWRVYLAIDSPGGADLSIISLSRRSPLSSRLQRYTMVVRAKKSKRTTSPVPEDPFQPASSTYVRAKDGNPLPTKIEIELAKRAARPSSPSLLPGVRPIPKELSESLRDQLVPGKYYAKSMTQYLGPFDNEPTAEELPSGDTYFILQNMGRLGGTGKCIFRHVKQIDVPTREFPPPRPISPSELPGVRSLNDELDADVKENLVPGQYYAKSMNRYLGPFDSIPSIDVLPSGDSYVILQEMGRLPNGSMIFRRVTQIDR